MDLRVLQIFVEVVRQGGFSAAGRTVFASQPTVSKAVKQLEDEVGTLLIDRVGHQARPTAAGDLVYRRAVTMLAERDHLEAELASLQGLKRGRLRLGLSRLGSSILCARVLAEFRGLYPGIDIELFEHGSLRLTPLLREGELELAMCLLPLPGDFDWQQIHDDPLMAILPLDHPLAGREACTLSELADSPFILFEEGFGLNPQILDACQRRGFSPRIAAHSGQADFIQTLVATGLGVAFLPRLVVGAGLQGTRTCALKDDADLRWKLALAWRRDGQLSPAAAAYLELTRKALAQV